MYAIWKLLQTSQTVNIKSEVQFSEQGADERVLPLAVCQENMQQPYYVEEEHKNPPLVVRDGAQESEACPISP